MKAKVTRAKRYGHLSPNRRLTGKDALFVAAYVQHWNGAQAVREAGFTHKRPAMYAYDLLRKPHILKAVEVAREDLDSLHQDWARQALGFLALQVGADPRAMFAEDGTPLSIKKLANAEASLVVGFETEGGVVTKMKLSDRRAAAEGILKQAADWKARAGRRGPIQVTVDPSQQEEEEADVVVRARRVAFALRLGVEAGKK